MTRIIMIQESKWTVINGQAHDTHIVCVQHTVDKGESSIQHWNNIKILSNTTRVFQATDTILQKCVIPQCNEKVKI